MSHREQERNALAARRLEGRLTPEQYADRLRRMDMRGTGAREKNRVRQEYALIEKLCARGAITPAQRDSFRREIADTGHFTRPPRPQPKPKPMSPQEEAARARKRLAAAVKRGALTPREQAALLARLETIERPVVLREIATRFAPAPKPISPPKPAAPPDEESDRTPAQLAALAAARLRRASAAKRQVPAGYRSIEHLLDSAAEHCGRAFGGQRDLARYLGVDESSVRRWLKREKIPLQPTLDSIALYLARQR